ncbi:cellulase family glycosylhydrolase [Chitinispirillales bacterium ANBcel5]|uniref:cellulase family glycosylhydrolase n=1 Tax=Cellulosispirillum alkaliphilum TaxID=3039283 RepID=UPI002A5479CC|nr:cellulase family glycosylhydrolase [Chitinispirillales bacterium ANBcel5]
MKKFLLLVALSVLFCAVAVFSATPVAQHGQLSTTSNRIVDQSGNTVQLRGMSLFWSQWEGGRFYNSGTVDWLIDDWRVNVVRAAMGANHHESGSGYVYDNSEEYKVRDVVEAAIARGIYVIIDWHSYEAQTNTAEAVDFFSRMARDYGNHPNIIYEIYNEPTGVEWDTVKDYASQVIPAIRQHDSDNIIIVGTPNWSQDVDDAANDPISGSNIAYAFHFYASDDWHQEDLRAKADYAKNSIPIFVTEWGLTQASGDGHIDIGRVDAWVNWMEQNQISWTAWSIVDKDETSAALQNNPSSTGNWSPDQLTQSGSYLREKIRELNPSSYSDQGGDTGGGDTGGGDTGGGDTGGGDTGGGDTGGTLLNGDFSQGDDYWNLEFHDGAGSGGVTNGEYRISIEDAGSEPWHVQFTQSGIRLEEGKTYRFSFDARAEGSRTIEANIGMADDPWQSYIGEGHGVFDLTASMQTFQIEFTMTHTTDDNSRVEFNAGSTSSEDVFIDNVIIEEHTPASSVNNAFVRKGGLFMEITSNPLSPVANITFNVIERNNVVLQVFDVTGRLVDSFRPGVLDKGIYNYTFNRSSVPSGVYYVRLNTGNSQVLNRKMVLMN